VVAHVVLYRPRPDLDPAAARELAETLAAAPEHIPTIRRVWAGRRVDGPAYPFGPFPDLPYIGVVEFDDRDGLTAYLTHPFHGRLAQLFAATTAAAQVYDYEMFEGAAVARLGA
jgi:hypothetical protein